MSLTAASEPVPLVTDAEGVIRVGGTRVTLDTVITAYRRGESPEQIGEAYPSLRIADVYGVIAYYLRHQDEMDTYLAGRREQARKAREELEERFPPAGVRERLERRLR